MIVLLVSKKSHFVSFPERYQEASSERSLPENPKLLASLPCTIAAHARRVQDAHLEHIQTVEKTLKYFSESNIAYRHISREEIDDNFDFTPYELVITLGGDGTLLTVSHFLRTPQSKILGIKSSSYSKGFLCTVVESELADLVSAIRKNLIPFVPVNRLVAEITSEVTSDQTQYSASKITVPVLNEFLFAHSSPAGTSRYQLAINGQGYEEQKSSGIWIAAPAGSTAAILSAGGEKMSLTDKDYQYWVRELCSPDPDLARYKNGRVDLSSNAISIKSLCEEAILAADGHHGFYPINFGDTITFKPGPILHLGRFA